MNKELLQEAQVLWDTSDKLSKFGRRFNVYPLDRAGQVHSQMLRLHEQIPDRSSPASPDELHEGELKRTLRSRAMGLEHFLTGNPYTIEDIISLHGLESTDLASLQPWLAANRGLTVSAIERLFDNTTVENFEHGLPLDVPSIKQQAEGFAATQITNYHKKLGNLFEDVTSTGNYLHRITSQPTTEGRSYFNSATGRLALGMTAICYEVEDGTIQLRERELLRLFGHEGMGHALQEVITKGSDLPFFLKEGSNATIASQESVTQHYERVIFEDVKNSPKTQRDLGIADRFADIYQEEQDTQQITDYNRNLFYYAILVLADKSHGDMRDPEVVRRKIDELGDVALSPSWANGIVEANRYQYDSQGNLNNGFMSELRYASKAVDRAFEKFKAHGYDYSKKDHRSHIDMTFLTGYYTPQGFVQKAELAANGKLV